MWMHSNKFLQKYEETENERSRLANALHEFQVNVILELERQHEKQLKESTEHTNRLLKQFDQFT